MPRPSPLRPAFSLTKRGDVFYIQFWSDGAAHRVSTKSFDREEAEEVMAEFSGSFDPKRWAGRRKKVSLRQPVSRLMPLTVSLIPSGPLLTAAQIVLKAEFTTDRPGIYFLIRGDVIVYVGQALSVQRRVAEHLGAHDFDGWSWTPCPANDLLRLERAYLDALRPELNRDSRTNKLRRHAA